jgi:hypothetical protein
MNKTIAASLLICSAFFCVDAQTRSRANNNPVPSTISMLPSSDMVIALEADTLFNSTLPQVLSINKKMLGNLEATLESLKSQTGLDFRKMKHVVVGLTARKNDKNEIFYEPLIIAKGRFDDAGVQEIARLASSDNFKTETVAGRTIYRFSVAEIAAKNKPEGNTLLDSILQTLVSSLDRELALVAFDVETVVMGSPEKLEEFLLKSTRVSLEIVNQLNRRQGALMRMVVVTPRGLEEFIRLDDDTLGEDLGSIRIMSGSLQTGPKGVTVSMTARTASTSSALSLKETLDGFKSVLPSMFAGQRGEDKKIYGKMAGSIKLSRLGTTINLDLTVPQSDIDLLIAEKN